MSIADTPFFALLRNRLGYLNQRQQVLANNVANASTPKFIPKDMDESAFTRNLERSMPNLRSGASAGDVPEVSMVSTSPMHINTSVISSRIGTIRAPDSETTMDGNAVVLEDQMIKVADTRMNYNAAISLYQKGLQLMRLAAKRPGG